MFDWILSDISKSIKIAPSPNITLQTIKQLTCKMVKIILLILLTLMTVGRCDMIGYNRLRNNVSNHSRFRGTSTGTVTLRSQMFRMMLLKDRLASAYKRELFETLYATGQTSGKTERNERLKQYRQRMNVH